MLVVLVCAGLGLGAPQWAAARGAAQFPVQAADLAAGRQALTTLQVRDRDPLDGYSRDRFGTAWADVDRNGCDTRNDVLARDLTEVVVDDDGCRVLTGTLDDPYTGEQIDFVRGEHSADVQIDHVVALAEAWRTGAASWDAARRLALANDPANLLAVQGAANQAKGAGDASEWLPSSGYRCAYVLEQIRVKAAYSLWVTAQEQAAMGRVLSGCRTA
ncbi:MAG: HNH endonuclease family protein [Cellulomonas sp.]|nr:HNH endonuclease family protein [Cellulomonas sp.]